MSVRIIGGSAKGRKLPSARGVRLRPTSERVRGAIFSILGQDAVEGVRVLDLYAGTGALGLEALSRGALWVDFVESGARQCEQISLAVKVLGFETRSHVYQARVGRALDMLKEGYDLVMMDPPYQLDDLGLILARIGEGGVLSSRGLLVVEHSSRRPLEKEYGRLSLKKSRRYGDSTVSIYSLGESDD